MSQDNPDGCGSEGWQESAGLSGAIPQKEKLIFNEDGLKMSKTTELKSLHQRQPRCVGETWKNGDWVGENGRTCLALSVLGMVPWRPNLGLTLA